MPSSATSTGPRPAPVARPVPSPQPPARRAPVLWLSGALAGALVLLYLRDPHVPGSYGICPSLAFGFACPGCGGLRATNELLHGDLAAAWSYNPLAVLLLPAVVAILVRWALDVRARRPAWVPTAAWIVAFAVVLLVFGILRNIPALTPYLGPLAFG